MIAGLIEDLAGDVTIGVSSLVDLAGDVTVGVASPDDLAGDVTVGVSSLADLAGVVTVGVASSASLAGDVTVDVASLADHDSVVTAGVAYREECGDCVVVLSDCVCDYDDYFYDGQYDDCPDYHDYDDPDDYSSFPSVYGFVGPDDYELYHDRHGSDDCRRYCVSRGTVSAVSTDVPHWSENREHNVLRGDVILARTGSNELPAVLEDSVVGAIGSGGPWCGSGEAVETPRKWSSIRSVGTLFERRWRGSGCA